MRPRILVVLLLALACNRELPTSPNSPGQPSDPFSRASLTGHTVDPTGKPVPHVIVAIYKGDAIQGTTVSGDDGSFAFQGLSAGLHSLLLRVNNGPEQRGGTVQLLLGANAHDVVVSSCIVPYGTVRDASTGRPIMGAKVTIFGRESVTDVNGRYQIDFGCEYVQGSTIIMKAEHPDYETSQTLTRASFLCTCAWDFLLKRR